MPRRKKSSFSQSSLEVASKAKREEGPGEGRAGKESPAQRQQRLEIDRHRAAARRANESQEKWEKRLKDARERQAARVANETICEREIRQRKNREQTAAARLCQSTEERGRRLKQDRLSKFDKRLAPFKGTWKRSAFNYDPQYDYSTEKLIGIGSMSKECSFCKGMKWERETTTMCCGGGKVVLPTFGTPPDTLKALLLGNTLKSIHFLKNIRSYNSAFQMTSFDSNIIREGNFMPTFKVQGQVYHRIGSLLPTEGTTPQFLQLYFVADYKEQALQRSLNIPNLKEELIFDLQDMLHTHNSYIRSFKYVLKSAPPNEYNVVINSDKSSVGEHRGRYNAPAANEVAVIITGEEYGRSDIVIQGRGDKLQCINATHRSYDALQYPLICVFGQDGYHFGIKQTDPKTGAPALTKTISCIEFYAYLFMLREQDFNILHRSHGLFQQFAVDMYAKIEGERLLYIRTHQKELRASDNIHLRDAISNEGTLIADNIGSLCVILPSSFTGSPRYMHEHKQDALTYVRHYGCPQLFITFICNPTWHEIKSELYPVQEHKDRHDIIARVFRLKVIKLIDIIKKGEVFGPVKCDMYTIEWQKRGLPLAHILIWLCERIRSNDIDSLISAELPDQQQDPLLHEIVKSQMIHGPCGSINPSSPCMRDGKCTKNYPRASVQETQTGKDGYSLYRRRKPGHGGFTSRIKIRNGQEFIIDNRWVVPYCPILTKSFKAHINVEFCNSVKSIKYVCKYLNKGSDAATYTIVQDGNQQMVNKHDEVAQYERGRYISSNEAFWHIFNFPIHERHPAIIKLSVHLENGQRVIFTEQIALQQALSPKETTLTAFFKLCQEDEDARKLLYPELPKYYTWRNKKWYKRKRGDDALGRVYSVHPSQTECYYLRLLLHEVRGPKSFHDLRRVNAQVCETYREACYRRGLLENDDHWDLALTEASVSDSPRKLRNLFAIMLNMCQIHSPLQLWMKHREDMAEDLRYVAQQAKPGSNIQFSEEIFNRALIEIEDQVLAMGGKNLPEAGSGLPKTNRQVSALTSKEIARETNYDIIELAAFVNEYEPKLLPEQRCAYDEIISSVREKKGGIFFLDAPGGTGKTFVTTLLLSKVRQHKIIALAVASSGIAATFLPGGRTAHSAFRLPLNLVINDSPVCNISKGSGSAEVLRQCHLIIWDECTMSHRSAMEALDRTLQDIRDNTTSMGGVTLVLSGDFRQTLPVIPRGTRADEIKACIKSSWLWNKVQKFSFNTNVRALLHEKQCAEQFSTRLLQLGNGKVPIDGNGDINLAHIAIMVDSPAELKNRVFLDLSKHYNSHKWLCERAILAPKNETIARINHELMNKIPTVIKEYKSVDSVLDENQAVHYPTEFLNSLEPSGTPPHKLFLKVGVPIMLLINLDPPKLCNGTRLIVKTLSSNVIEATIITGCASGEDIFIPRIPIKPTDMPFEFKRTQFPVRLCFAMSINKAQGQTLKYTGLHLSEPCFSHGQLYVGCSRVGSSQGLFVYAPNQKTKNIVYTEALI